LYSFDILCYSLQNWLPNNKILQGQELISIGPYQFPLGFQRLFNLRAPGKTITQPEKMIKHAIPKSGGLFIRITDIFSSVNFLMKVYFIPGIAADSRIFKHIRLPEGFEPVFINWIKPFPLESLSAYASRLAEKINRAEPFFIIGVSLGGIMASEISTIHNPKATIIIGSVPVAAQLPGYYRWVRKLNFQKIVPGRFYKTAAIIKNFLASGPSADKKMIIKMIRDSDPRFIRWGIDAVLTWTNQIMPKNLIHIHGTRDEVFPFAYTSPTHVIRKGTHVLVLTHAEEINLIIRETLCGR
jgi:pimeloyl-ACP methyl ester carboxylesterase